MFNLILKKIKEGFIFPKLWDYFHENQRKRMQATTRQDMVSKAAERVTIMLNGDIAEKLRDIQAKQIKETQSSVSFSRIVNDTLEKGLG